MIESSIINWIDLGDSMQSLDIYGKKKLIIFFNFIRVLINFKSFSIFFYIILKFFFFLQIMMLCLVNIDDDSSDSAVTILKYISKVIFIQEIVDDKKSYEIAVIINSVLTVIIILCIVYLGISIHIGKFYIKIPIHIFNLINVILLNYLIGPIIQLSILSTNCDDGIHKYLGEECFKNWKHIVILAVSIINLLFYLLLSIILSIYYNEIGSINDTKVLARINCNYEIYMNLAKIVMFVFSYVVQYYGKDKDIYKIILEGYIFLNALAFSIYVYKTVLFYDNRMNIVTLFGWIFVAWFAFIILIKTLLDLNDTTIFHIIGWIILGFIIHFMEEYRAEYLLTDYNIFEAKSLKEIELFNQSLLSLMNQRSIKAKTLLIGIVKKFEDYANTTPELKEKFLKLSNNDHLRKKFNSGYALSVLSVIYIIYEHHLDKSLLKNDILLNMCYFLLNKLKNPTFAVSLCSKYKVVSHKHLFFKYIQMEEIKEFLINKLSKSNNKESIKHVQIGSVILYNLYIELFKLKIYESATNQIDYFDILKNTATTPKTTKNFLKLGEEILTLRKEILKLWEKIVELNPFSDESEKDFMLYLEEIIQDDILARTEAKKFSTLKTNKLSERNNIYHSMFNKDYCSIILIDGYSSNGKILYSTPNFPQLFNFYEKDILNMSLDDLLPNVVQPFHKELVDNAIKFANVNYVFNTQRDFLIKCKNNGTFNVKMFIKCVPNLSYGLIYMVHITKFQEHNYIISLDKDLKISCLPEVKTEAKESLTMGNSYFLTPNLYGHHIGTVLPEILYQLEYKDQQFSIPKIGIDLKGTLYPSTATKELDSKVDSVIERIRQSGKLQSIEDQKRDTIREYDDLIEHLSNKVHKTHSVFYKIITKSFLDGKYKYHRVYITNDLIALNENVLDNQGMQGYENYEEKKNEKNESALSSVEDKESIKQIKLRTGESDEIFGDKKEDEKKEENLVDDEKKKGIEQPGGDFSKPSSSPSSLLTKSSVDSASFNKLKNGILEKKEVTSIKIMKYLCLIFGVCSIVLIILNSFTVKDNFEDLDEYLKQNLFFNHSKISVSCIFLNTLNLRWYKHNTSGLNGIKDKDSYTNLIIECIEDIKTLKENSSYFYDDYKNILGMKEKIQLDVFNLDTQDSLTIDIDNLLNLLISNGLKLKANLNEYLLTKLDDTIYDVNSQNLLKQSLNYIHNEKVKGFNDDEKKDKIKEQFTPIPIYLIIDCAIFLLLTFGYGYLIFKLNDMENKYLDKLIKFHSANFDIYLKKLDENKKKLRNDNGDDEEKLNGDMEEFGSKKGSKKDDEDEDGDKKNKKKKRSESKEEKEEEKDDKKKTKKKSRLNKQNKIQQQRNEKKKIMSQYFFKYNVLFTLKVMIVLIISITYYLVMIFVEKSKKNDYLDFDSTTNAIEGVYKSSFDIFLLLKVELENYEYTIFNGETAVEYPIAENETRGMNIPENSKITTPKLGNLLMPLVNEIEGASQATVDLNSLYNSDACAILFAPSTSEDYATCSVFW